MSNIFCCEGCGRDTSHHSRLCKYCRDYGADPYDSDLNSRKHTKRFAVCLTCGQTYKLFDDEELDSCKVCDGELEEYTDG